MDIYGLFYHKKTALFLYQDKLVLKKGLVILSESYARFANIKNIGTTRYPFIKNGKLQINIAGELIPEQQYQGKYNQQQQTAAAAAAGLANKLIIEYVDDSFTTMDAVEEFLQHKVMTAGYDRAVSIKTDIAKVLLKSKSSMSNTVIPFMLLSIILPLLWIYLPILILKTYKRSYSVEQDRIVCYSGIINLNKTSVLFARIDNINIREGMWNKIFKTASILVETLGSTKPALTFSDIPSYTPVYDLLKAEYQKKG